MKVQEPERIADGLHKGIIVGVEERHKPYEYLDLHIDCDGKGIILKAGYPAKTLIADSKLGQMLTRFGCVLNVGADIDIKAVMLNKTCQFVTMTKGKFAEVLPDSVKP